MTASWVGGAFYNATPDNAYIAPVPVLQTFCQYGATRQKSSWVRLVSPAPSPDLKGVE